MNIKFLLYFVVPVIFAAGITLVGAVMLFFDSRKRANDVKTGDWLPTGGKVTAVQPDSVQYTYTVVGKEYQGTAAMTPKIAAQNTYAENAYVLVQYNPKNPAESLLDSMPRSANYINFFGWLFAAFGILSCCFTGFMAIIILGAAQ